ncbi:DNA repair protein rad16 [Allomyces javanicus]|nr:DNA repair protein rad16 [Allomyces javanicus]
MRVTRSRSKAPAAASSAPAAPPRPAPAPRGKATKSSTRRTRAQAAAHANEDEDNDDDSDDQDDSDVEMDEADASADSDASASEGSEPDDDDDEDFEVPPPKRARTSSRGSAASASRPSTAPTTPAIPAQPARAPAIARRGRGGRAAPAPCPSPARAIITIPDSEEEEDFMAVQEALLASTSSAAANSSPTTAAAAASSSSSAAPKAPTAVLEIDSDSDFFEAPAQANNAAHSDLSASDDEDEPIAAMIAAQTQRARTEAARRRQEVIDRLNDPELMGLTPRERRSLLVRRAMDSKLKANHPDLDGVWERIPDRIDPEPVEQPEHLKLKMLPYQVEGLAWLIRQEEEFGGGLLADEMGMGKTISTIALLLARRRRPTLIVAPTVALNQWMSEITNHIADDGQFKMTIFQGSKRVNEESALLENDVLITSYSVIEAAFRKQEYGFKRKAGTVKEASALHQVEWARIVLDECHSIKDRSTNTARAVFALKSQYKWCLSGTPVQNRVGEMYSVIRFLQLDPFAYYFCRNCPCKSLHWKFSDKKSCDECGHRPMNHFCYWNYSILKPIQEFGPTGAGREAFNNLGRLLDTMMLRRTKIERADDLGLPPRHVTVRRDYFSEEERDFYSSLYSDSKRQFATYVAEGTVLNHYANIFELLTRMRQAANHPAMVTSKFSKPGTKAAGAGTKTAANGDVLVCGLCHEPAEDPITAKCKHVFCREDMRQYIDGYGDDKSLTCPVCFSKLVVDLDAAPVVTVEKPVTSIVGRIDMEGWRSSTKIEALLEELTNLRKQDHSIKSIVFSQYVSFLDLIHWRLRKAGFQCVKLDGRMNLQQRDAVIKAFSSDPHVTVFLISLKAGGVALNLTEASQIFLMDPWWNPAAESQAMDRIHRLGQYRPIRITRLIIEDSIEERIIQLQVKKQALFDSTVGKNLDALARLSEEDLKFLFVL